MKKFTRKFAVLVVAVLMLVTSAMPTMAVDEASTNKAVRVYSYKVSTVRYAYRNLSDDDIVFISPSSTVLKADEKVTYKPTLRQDATYRMSETWTAVYVDELVDFNDSRKVLIPTGSYPSSLRSGNRIKINYKLVAVKYTSSNVSAGDGTANDDYLYNNNDIYLDMR